MCVYIYIYIYIQVTYYIRIFYNTYIYIYIYKHGIRHKTNNKPEITRAYIANRTIYVNNLAYNK